MKSQARVGSYLLQGVEAIDVNVVKVAEGDDDAVAAAKHENMPREEQRGRYLVTITGPVLSAYLLWAKPLI
jgi:hypothetical protein